MGKKKFGYMCIFFALYSCLFLSAASGHVKEFLTVGLTYYLGGPVGDVYSPLEMLWWLLIFTPVWVFCGKVIDSLYSKRAMLIYRYGSVKHWWFEGLIKVYGFNLIYFVIFGILLKIFLGGAWRSQLFTLLLVLLLHSSAMITVMLWLMVFIQKLILCISALIVLESISKMLFLFGIQPAIMPMLWGMYGYSDQEYGDGGFLWPWTAVIQVVFILSIFVIPVRGKMRYCLTDTAKG